MWQSLPEFGTGVLYAILVVAAYTMAVAIAAGRGRPRLLQAARLGAYGTVALVGLAVFVLAYAFVSHDFRISYVARYSDRSMTTPYLITALWGGQDGSLLWWLFLTSVWTGGCVLWLRRRYLELQPYVIATLMSVILFFSVLMVFGDVNPFATFPGGAPVDGSGLNFQLRNFYMIIHPPSLYTGFTASAIPFAFAVAALATGRLDSEWIVASRTWMLFAWLFLSIGNALGMLWAYEELGWGGYWAWDPVENAAFLPWLTASAFVHSVMIQERRGMLKMWNVFLICLTFFLTIFGTFLTRSGLIASVHSFAQSGIGIFFIWYMALIIAVCAALIVYRAPLLRSEGAIESVLSRETAFVLNNWGFVSLTVFITVATTWPRISEWLLEQKSTLGPSFYNTWIPPIALVIFALMGAAPLLGWRKSSPELFKKSFTYPVAAMVLAGGLHLAFGKSMGFPAFVKPDPIYPGLLGDALANLGGILPFVTVALCAFNVTVVVQEFQRGISARQKKGEESLLTSFFLLVARSRRRYGGYVVHVGIVVMFLGFTGRAWGVDKEISLSPGEKVQIEEYELTYVGPRMEVDSEKRMVFADLDVLRHGEPVGRLSPAKFIYKATPGQPSTEIAKYITARNDLYVIIGMANPETKVASFQLHVNPLVSFIWLGVLVLILGATISMWPDVSLQEAGAWSYVRAAAGITTAVLFSWLFASGPSLAYAGPRLGEAPATTESPRRTEPLMPTQRPSRPSRPSRLRLGMWLTGAAFCAAVGTTAASAVGQFVMDRTGTVGIESDAERKLFFSLLCTCGCPRETLGTCTCGFAHQRRDELRVELAEGKSTAEIQADYVARFGTQALAVPPNEGSQRWLFVAPLVAIAAGAGFVVMSLRRWQKTGGKKPPGDDAPKGGSGKDAGPPKRDAYDDKLDAELGRLDE